MTPCRWHKDTSLPEGRFLVPGCWSRAVYGDHAPCNCPRPPKRLPKAARAHLDSLIAMRLDRDQIDEALQYVRRATQPQEDKDDD
jgi:hypothetical protein